LAQRPNLSRPAGGAGGRLLIRQACVALDEGKLERARVCLQSGLALDNENVGLQILWARLLALEGDVRSAQKALIRVAKLDVGKQFQGETTQAMETLSPLDSREERTA
jgi:thioredoxin-like negative regulator of GroEL